MLTSHEQTVSRVARPKVVRKIIRGRAVGDLHRARAERQAAEFLVRLRHLADHVEHHLGPHAADGGVGEIALVVGVGLVRLGRQLIRAARADVAHEPLEVVVVLL